MKTILNSQRLAGAFLVVFGSMLVAPATSIDRVIATGLSPATFPNLLAWGLIVFGVSIAFMPPPPASEEPKFGEKARFGVVGILIYVALGTVSIFVLDTVGFIIVALVLIVSIGLRLGAKPVPLIITAIVMPVIAQILFENGFGVPLSHGLLEGVLG
jgi:hypothetical protein